MNVKQTGGSHYECMAYQPIDFILDIKADFPTGCVIKYVSRYKMKNGAEDLQKAIDNITFMQEYKGYEMRLDCRWGDYMTRYERENQLSENQNCALWALLSEHYEDAIMWINLLKREYERGGAE